VTNDDETPRAGRSHSQAEFEASYDGTPPWDIDRPQPALAELATAGEWRAPVLDAGCGTGEHALLAAALGLEATGIDFSPSAIEQARAKAAARDLAVEFRVGDALELGADSERFATVVDSGLFHVFDDAMRVRYAAALHRATAPGGRLFLLCFSEHEPGEYGPRRVRQDELRAVFADGWQIDAIDDARIITTFSPEGVFAWRASITRR
jgi:SAM-dependent methyltransferase